MNILPISITRKCKVIKNTWSVPKSPTKLGLHLGNGCITADIANLQPTLIILGKMEGCVDVYAFCGGVDGTIILSDRDKRCLSAEVCTHIGGQ